MPGKKIKEKKLFFNKDSILKRDFYERDTADTAKDLLGKILVTNNEGRYSCGIIVENEAYYGSDDPASHAFRGSTRRSEIMFGIPGFAYVYLCYGNHYLFNCVTEKPKTPGAVLIRSCAPLYGIDIMKERTKNISDLLRGPGRLTKALGIDLSFNRADLTKNRSPVFIIDGSFIYENGYFEFEENLLAYLKIKNENIGVSARIGIKNGADKPLRFYIKDNAFLSVKNKKNLLITY